MSPAPTLSSSNNVSTSTDLRSSIILENIYDNKNISDIPCLEESRRFQFPICQQIPRGQLVPPVSMGEVMEVSPAESVSDLTQEHRDLLNRNMKDTALGQTHPQDLTQVCMYSVFKNDCPKSFFY